MGGMVMEALAEICAGLIFCVVLVGISFGFFTFFPRDLLPWVNGVQESLIWFIGAFAGACALARRVKDMLV